MLDDYKILGEYGVKMALYNKFMHYQQIIDDCIDRSEPIPATIAKLYFTLFQNLWHVKKKRTKKVNNALIKEVFQNRLSGTLNRRKAKGIISLAKGWFTVRPITF